MESIEEIKKRFFIEEDISKEELVRYLSIVSDFSRINPKTGKVVFVASRRLSLLEKILLFLISRYLANKLEKNISEYVSIKELRENPELASYEPKVISARISEAMYKGYLERSFVERGVYKINPYKINHILKTIASRRR